MAIIDYLIRVWFFSGFCLEGFSKEANGILEFVHNNGERDKTGTVYDNRDKRWWKR